MDNDLILYSTADGKTKINLRETDGTVWLTQAQMAELFDTTPQNITLHIKAIYADNEIDEKATCKNYLQVQNEGQRQVKRTLKIYSLDMILAVGMRVRSVRGTQFRIWAIEHLKQYLLEGFALNQKRLSEERGKRFSALQNSVGLVQRGINRQITSLDEANALMRILSDFSQGLKLLDDFDNQTLDATGKTNKEAVRNEAAEFLAVVEQMKTRFGSGVFANPKDDGFNSSVNQIYQTFGGQDCYPALEEKAAMLLYLITKNHSFWTGTNVLRRNAFCIFWIGTGFCIITDKH